MNIVSHELADRFRRHRAVRTAGRIVLWAAVVLVVGRGVVSLVAGPAGAAKTTAPAAAIGSGDATFPGPDAQALAVRFTADYLTYDEINPVDWQNRLAGYGSGLAAGWDGKGHQTVTAVVPAATTPAGPAAGTVTVAARSGSRWVYLAVPMVATPAGPAIAGRPAFVAAPATGAAPVAIGADGGDAGAAEALRPTVEAFVAAWAAGTQPVITALSADGARLPRPEVGSATLAGIDGLVVAKAAPQAAERTAVVTVRWADSASGASLTQPYRLTLARAGDRWLIRSLGPDLPIPGSSSLSSRKEQ